MRRQLRMNELQVFSYQSKEVRTIIKEGEIWWVAQDVCNILDLSDVSMSMQRVDDDEKLIQKLLVSGQKRDVWTVNEQGLYSLILTSNKPEAKTFKRWITHEVLPSIRKTGSYSTPSPQSIKERELQVKIDREKRLSMKQITDFVNRHEAKLSSACIQQVLHETSKVLLGTPIVSLPVLETKHYTATELGAEFQVTSTKIGKLANLNNLKTDPYGKWVLDKKKHCDGQVECFLYNETGRETLRKLIDGEIGNLLL